MYEYVLNNNKDHYDDIALVYFGKEYIETALHLISTPNTGLLFMYCSIYCGYVRTSEPAQYGLSLVCRLNKL